MSDSVTIKMLLLGIICDFRLARDFIDISKKPKSGII